MNRQHIPLTEAQIIAAEKGELQLETRCEIKVVQLVWLKPPFEQDRCDVLLAVLDDGVNKTYCIGGCFWSGGRISEYDLFVSEPKQEAFDIETYTPKGDIEGFPIEVVKWMLREQFAQGNKEDVTVFENDRTAKKDEKGFDWDKAKEFDKRTCYRIIDDRIFNVFFEKCADADSSDIVTGAKAEPKPIYEVGEIIETNCFDGIFQDIEYIGRKFDLVAMYRNGLITSCNIRYTRKKRGKLTVTIDGSVMLVSDAINFLSNL